MANELSFSSLLDKQREYFQQNTPSTLAQRKQLLLKLKEAIEFQQGELISALQQDLGKPEFESYLSEVGLALHDITHTLKHLKRWMKPKKVKTPLLSQPAKSTIQRSPLGVCLIIAPFNYPVGLTLLPLIAAIAAGNCCVIKTSELTPHVSRALVKLISSAFPCEMVCCVEGGVEETQALLAEKFAHIFFTGSSVVGKIVMQAAAKTLTPVTLELGGKSPCIICHDADIDLAAKRIVYGKMLNAGQTCIAPDYLLVDQRIKSKFIDALVKRVSTLYGEDASQSPDFSRIVNQRHTQRIAKLIDPNKVLIGGQIDIEQCYVAPTVLGGVQLQDAVMQEEIFGPLLPVLEFDSEQQVFDIIAQLPQHPLAAYIYSANKETQQRLATRIHCGGLAINHCLQHVINPYLPFGGVGESGIGSYHGEHGFNCFSHQKSVLNAATWLDNALLYPPYKGKLPFFKRLLR